MLAAAAAARGGGAGADDHAAFLRAGHRDRRHVRLVDMPAQHHVDPRGVQHAERGDRARERRGHVLELGRPHQVVMGDRDPISRGRRRREQRAHAPALRARDASADEGAVERGVDADDAHLVIDHMGLEHRRKMPPPGAERRERPLPEPVERHVVVARDRDRRARDGLDEALRRGELLRLGALREIARDDDVVGLAIATSASTAAARSSRCLGPKWTSEMWRRARNRVAAPIRRIGIAMSSTAGRRPASQRPASRRLRSRVTRPATRRVAVSPTAARIGAPLRTPSR